MLEIDPPRIVMTMINFLIFFFVFKKFFYEKVNNFIDQRNSEIKEKLQNAESEKKNAIELHKKNKEMIINTRNESKLILQEYKEKAEKVSQEIVCDAKLESQNIIKRANREIESEKKKFEEEMKNQIIDMSILLSSKVLQDRLEEDEHRKLIDKFISEVGN